MKRPSKFKISDLPEPVIRKICQLLIFSFQAKNEGWRSVLAFRSISSHFYRIINSCSLNITYEISKEHFHYNSNRAEFFLTHLVESTNWKFYQFSVLCSVFRSNDLTSFGGFFSDQKKLICSRYSVLFGNNLKTVVFRSTQQWCIKPKTLPLGAHASWRNFHRNWKRSYRNWLESSHSAFIWASQFWQLVLSSCEKTKNSANSIE